ncbi:MAG: heterodisulfide reductase-related iron-sulfur binding cluster [Bacteroidales bacterium]
MDNQGKQRIWSEYQKEIADDHFFYVRSCIRQTFYPGSEQFFLDFMRNVLGKDVFENPSHTTCTGIGYHGDIVPLATIMTVVARHFALMKESGYRNIAISCVTSFGIYTEIIETWKHFPEQLDRTREYLFRATGREFDIPENMAHTSDIIFKFRDEISTRAKNLLVNKHTGEPLKVAEHIGCHYSKMFPKYGVGGAEFPRVLSGMAEAWGGRVIDYPERRHCCGFGFRQYLVKANRGYSLSNTTKKFESMKPYKPDMVLTNCPGCNMFMDKWQYTIKEMEGVTYGLNGESIPVLTYEELAGLVLGYNPWDLGLQYHMVQSEPLLKKMGIEYDPDDKYRTKDGRQMPIPKNLMNV